MAVRTGTASPFGLRPAERARLASRCAEALRRARRGRAGHALAAITVRLADDVDPSAVVVASRRADEPWFCFEQPDRDASALGALGCVHALDETGPERFRAVARRWRALTAEAVYD